MIGERPRVIDVSRTRAASPCNVAILVHMNLSLSLGTVLAATIATIVNVGLLVVGKPLVGTPGSFGPLFYTPIIVSTVVGCLGAGMVFALTRRLSDHPETTFTMIAFVVLVLSFIPDLLLKQASAGVFAGATWGAVVLLMLMHVVAASSVLLVFLNIVVPARES
jgi:hypothetical protein